MEKEKLEELLIVGAEIRVGKKYAEFSGFTEGEVLELEEGDFEYENGLYTAGVLCPAIWSESKHEYDSIYHLFGNDLEDFMDCEIIN